MIAANSIAISKVSSELICGDRRTGKRQEVNQSLYHDSRKRDGLQKINSKSLQVGTTSARGGKVRQFEFVLSAH